MEKKIIFPLLDSINETSVHGDHSHFHEDYEGEETYLYHGVLSVAVRGNDNATLEIRPIYCREYCPDALDVCGGSMTSGNWSDASVWANNADGYPLTVPTDDEDVLIGPCLNLTLDVDTPNLSILTINYLNIYLIYF